LTIGEDVVMTMLATDLAVYMMEMAGTPVGVRIEGVGRVGTIENFI